MNKMAELTVLYEKQGYLTSIPILSSKELQQARDAFTKLERKFGEHYTSYNLHNVHMEYDWVRALTKHPKVLEVITTVLGPDILLLDSQFICKYPVSKLGLPHSQNNKNMILYSQRRDKFEPDQKMYWAFDGGPIGSVWPALDDSLEDNSALQVIPGIKAMQIEFYNIPEELVQKEKAVLCPLLAGQMSIHDRLLVHTSDPNMSDRRHCSFVICYVPTAAFSIQVRILAFLSISRNCFPAIVLVSGDDKYNHFSIKSPKM
uniref:Phytanoyl-CoA 2-hydroxylase n=1 Tax=Electrophorus electricus TaxID=8005 RepID=A0A4W4HGK7_ELEEL